MTFQRSHSDDEELERRLSWINEAIDKGFRINSEFFYQYNNEAYLDVTLVRYPPEGKVYAQIREEFLEKLDWQSEKHKLEEEQQKVAPRFIPDI